jgi:hypothetical protein
LAGFEEGGGHASALAHLTDKERRPAYRQVFETSLDLIHGDVDRAGDVAGGEFGSRADVDELELRGVGPEFGDCQG